MKNNFSNPIEVKKELNIEEQIEEIHNNLQDFFGFKLEEQPKVTFINSRKELNEYYGEENTPDWLIAFVGRDGGIYITSYDKFYEVSNGVHKKEEFLPTLKHEFVHKYFYEITGTSFPRWLNEGLANYLAGQKKKPLQDDELLEVFNYFSESNNNGLIYQIGYYWTRFLIVNFGNERLLELLSDIKNNKEDDLTEEIFKELFYKVYGFEYSKEDFKNLLDNKK